MAPSKGDLSGKFGIRQSERKLWQVRPSDQFHQSSKKKGPFFNSKNKGFFMIDLGDEEIDECEGHIKAATSFSLLEKVFLQLIFSHLLDEILRNSASVGRDYPCTRNIIFISLSCNAYKHAYIYIYVYIAPYTTIPIHELRSRTRWVFQIEANSSNVVISARAPNSKNLGSMISGILVEGTSHSATSWVSS